MTDREKNHTDSGTVGAVEITAVRQQKNEVLAKFAGFSGATENPYGWVCCAPDGETYLKEWPDLLHRQYRRR